MNDERTVFIRAMVMSRCPELTEDEVAEAFVRPSDADMVPGSIVMQIMEVIDRMSERQDRYEAELAASEPVVLPPRLHGPFIAQTCADAERAVSGRASKIEAADRDIQIRAELRFC